MTKDEALKMAIEALKAIAPDEDYMEVRHGYDWHDAFIKKPIQACKEALEQPSVAQLNNEYLRDTHVDGLEQPAQEPVEISTSGTFPLPKVRYESYQWQGLSDDELANIYDELFVSAFGIDEDYIEFAGAIEQALKEKNHA